MTSETLERMASAIEAAYNDPEAYHVSDEEIWKVCAGAAAKAAFAKTEGMIHAMRSVSVGGPMRTADECRNILAEQRRHVLENDKPETLPSETA